MSIYPPTLPTSFRPGGPTRALRLDENGSVEPINNLYVESLTIGSGGAGITADALATTGANVDVGSAAPPLVGQVLQATSAVTATWQTPVVSSTAESLQTTGASVDISVAAPPTVSQILRATSATTAEWQNENNAFGGVFNNANTDYVFNQPAPDTLYFTGTDAFSSAGVTADAAAGSLTVTASGAGTYFIMASMNGHCITGSVTIRPSIDIDGVAVMNFIDAVNLGTPDSFGANLHANLVAGQVVRISFTAIVMPDPTETMRSTTTCLSMVRL